MELRPAAKLRSLAILLVFAPFALVACQSIDAGLDDEIMSSIKYDRYSCKQLVSARNKEAADFGLSRDAERDQSRSIRYRSALMPLGALVPDLRGSKARERGLARGRIDAMNRSLARRCGKGKNRNGSSTRS